MVAPIFADIVWPALYLHERLYTWWSIAFGLAIEFGFIRWLADLPAGRALWVTVVVNTISGGIGYFALIWLDLIREMTLGLVLYKWLNLGTFDWPGWLSACLWAALINTAIECTAMRLLFHIPITRRFFFWDWVANFLSVGVALASLWIVPINLN